uniref:F-box associated beta-propeller type 3 domain-containing protein n=1 Tax=Brassica oleracea var. oleracea TaxID=109376 RepID=A0A0D3CNY6_BRAOL
MEQQRTSSLIRVFTLGSWQESWRTVRTNLKHRCHDYACGQCIKGETYYLAYSKPGYDMVVMSFDVRSEIFYMIELPLGIDYIDYAVLISYDGRLACIDGDNDTRLWILEDASKHKWLFQDFQKITGIWFRKSSYIVFYDPVRNSFRRLKFEGIVDREFGNTMHAFPNHIENFNDATVLKSNGWIEISTVGFCFIRASSTCSGYSSSEFSDVISSGGDVKRLWSLPQEQYNKKYKGKSIQELDLSDCKCCIPSHRLMPSGTNCQQRLDLGAEVLKWSIAEVMERNAKKAWNVGLLERQTKSREEEDVRSCEFLHNVILSKISYAYCRESSGTELT